MERLSNSLKVSKLLFIALILISFSCINTKKFGTYYVKKAVVYKNKYGNNGKRSLHQYNIEKQIVTVKEEKGHLKISFAEDPGPGKRKKCNQFTEDKGKQVLSGDPKGSLDEQAINKKISESKTYFYYPADTIGFSSNDLERRNYYKTDDFKYHGLNPVFQTITIPFKFRGEFADSIPATIGTSFNAGFAFGGKWTVHKYGAYYKEIDGQYSYLSTKKKAFSLTGGGFLGPTVIALENDKNVTEIIDVDHSELGLTAGLFGVAGAGKFNLGLAVGWDMAVGRDGDKWIYDRKPWLGLVLGLDFVK